MGGWSVTNRLCVVVVLSMNDSTAVRHQVPARVRGGRFLATALAALCAMTALPQSAAAQGSNPIVVENQQPGTSAWRIPFSAVGSDGAGQVKGYASAVSVNKGETITFFVSVNPAQTYTMDVYRLGWYQGLGARLMQHVGTFNGVSQAACPIDSTTGMIECNWTPSYTLATQPTWTSGIYLAVLTNAQQLQNYIEFVVRDDSRSAALLYQQPVTTYQAYNDYPYNSTGKSLYAFNSYGANTIGGSPAAVKASFNRPYDWDGVGGAWSANVLGTDYPFIRWMEKSGYDVTYTTDIDTDNHPGMLLNYRGVISAGHDEYFSKTMYDGFVAARDAGVNLGFFSADAVAWQIRLESGSRVMVCYRNATLDPIADPTLKTVQWRDPPLNRPEQTLIGIQYTAQVPWNPQTGGWANYVVANSAHWVYAGTGFKDGDQVPSIEGYESDRTFTEYPPAVAVPGTFTLLSQSTLGNGGANDFGNSSIYEAPSGAWVFAAGSIYWSWGLDNFNGYQFADARIQQVTANVLNRFVGPDFSVGVSPASRAVTPGASTTYAVTIGSTGGFSGSVTLSASGLPAGATGTFTPNPVTGASTLSVTTSGTTPLGTYPLVITGTNGSLAHSATVALLVNTPDFVLTPSPAGRTIAQGGSTSYAIAIGSIAGFSGSVSLNVSGLPNGAIGTFTPNPGTTSSSLVVTTSGSTPTGSFALTITGASGSLIHSTTVSLTINGPGVAFDNKVSAGVQFGTTSITTPAIVIGIGTNRAAMIMVAMSANTGTNITARLGGVIGTLVPGTDSGTTTAIRTLIFQVINPPSGSQTATVTWTTSMNADVGVITVSGADQVSPVSNGTFNASNSATVSTSVSIPSNFGDLTASIGFSGNAWMAPFTNQTLKWGLDASEIGGDVGPGTGPTTHTWTDQFGGQVHSVSGANFNSAAPNFTLTAAPASQSVTSGGAANYAITVGPTGGFSGQVTLSVNGLPTGANGTFTPNPSSGSSALAVTTSGTTPIGTYPLTITGVSGTVTHTANATLIVSPPPDFSVSASPGSQTVGAGGGTSYAVSITPANGFSAAVSLSVSGLPSGANGTFTPNPATGSSTLSISTSAATPAGTSTLTITGVSGSLTHAASATLVVSTPDFSVSATPSARTVSQGSPAVYAITIAPVAGFSGSANLSVSGLPAGAAGSFSPNPAAGSSTLTVTTAGTTPTGTSTLTITGTSGSLNHSTTASLTVTGPGVIFDNKVSSGFQWGVASANTPPFVIGSGPNRAAMIMVAMSANTATNITARLGGVAATLVPGTDTGASASIRTMIFQVINPPPGSQAATVSWTTAMNVDIGVITVSGANQVSPIVNGTFSASNSASAATSVTITSNSGDLTSSVGFSGNSWLTPFTNQTLNWGLDGNEVGADLGQGTGTTTHTWTDQFGGQSHAVSGANFKSAGS
jgi:hypothetical protein